MLRVGKVEIARRLGVSERSVYRVLAQQATGRRALDEIAEHAGWQVVEVYADEISGTKGRSGDRLSTGC